MRRQVEADPAGVRRRAWPQVDHDIVNCPAEAADDLHFGVRFGGKVQSANRPRPRVLCNRALREAAFQPMRFKQRRIEDPGETAAVVANGLSYEQVEAGKSLFVKPNGLSLLAEAVCARDDALCF